MIPAIFTILFLLLSLASGWLTFSPWGASLGAYADAMFIVCVSGFVVSLLALVAACAKATLTPPEVARKIQELRRPPSDPGGTKGARDAADGPRRPPEG